jgi:hypothetical protein
MVAAWRQMANTRKTTMGSILKAISKNIEKKG